MKNIITLIFVVLFSAANMQAQICSTQDSLLFYKKMNHFAKWDIKTLSKNEIVAKVGRSFIQTPYVAHSLEQRGDEQLVLNFLGLDCTTFLETAFTFAKTIISGDTSFSSYMKNLTSIRYRDGKIDGYPSRLHYFSDWIYDNIKKGLITERTSKLGGRPITFEVSFMSTHPESYRQLKENPAFIPKMKAYESEINKRTYYYVPKEEVHLMQDKINEGDFIAITTNLAGLDISHVGIAVKENNETHFLHAPLIGSEVQITKDDLASYLKKVKKHTGIIVFTME